MKQKPEKLGRLVREHSIAPSFLQRTVIVAALAFIFFLLTLVMASMWRNFLYIFLSMAFLMVYVLTMFGWLRLRKNSLKIYENGFTYRRFAAQWDELEAVEPHGAKGLAYEIRKKKGERIVLSDTLFEVEKAAALIRSRMS